MTKDDAKTFREMIEAALSLSREPIALSKPALRLWWTSLNPYPLETIQQAIDVHLRTSKYRLTPADIVEIINSYDDRPEPDVAWSTALKAADEFATVRWTEETAAAWATAQRVYATGDQIGARKTFLADYEKRVRENRLNKESVHWQISAGFDAQSRDAVIRDALDENLLTQNSCDQYLLTQISGEGKLIANCIGFDSRRAGSEQLDRNEQSRKLHQAVQAAKNMPREVALSNLDVQGNTKEHAPSESIEDHRRRKKEEEAARRKELDHHLELLKERYKA